MSLGVLRDRRIDLLVLVGPSFHAVTEGTDAFAEALPQLWQLLGTKNKQRHNEDDEQVSGL